MKKQLLLASSALALVLTGTAFAGGGEHMAAPAPAPAPAPAVKSGGFYAALGGGYIIPTGKVKTTGKDAAGDSASTKEDITDMTKSGFGFGGAVGYRFGQMPVRVEVGFNYNMFTLTSDSKDSGTDSFNGYNIMGRVFYDFDMGQFVPYVGLGVGYDSFTNKPKTGDSADFTGLGYEGIIGVDYKINDNFSVGASFTYHGTTAKTKELDIGGGNTVTQDLSSAQFMTIGLGLKYSF